MRARIKRPNILWRAFALGGITGLGVLSLSDDAWEQFDDATGGAVPREAVRAVFGITIGLHLFEALLVRRWTRKAQVPHRGAYTRTTLLYGLPTLPKARRAVKAHLAEAAEAA